MKTLSFVFLVCLFSASSIFAQQTPNLKDLGLLSIQFDPLSVVDNEIGLSDESVKSFVLEKFGKELPEIEIDLGRNDCIRVRIVTVKTNESTVVSYVSVELIRYVSILRDEDRQAIGNALAGVWENNAMLIGSADEMKSKIQEELGKQLSAFATEYRRQNPQESAKISERCPIAPD